MRKDKSAVVLDVRTPREFEAGHVPGAVNIPWQSPDFDKQVEKLDKSKTYLVHCYSGSRSTAATKEMTKLNFDHLFDFSGGMRRLPASKCLWKSSGQQSRQQIMHHLPVHVGQPEIAAGVAVGELFVVDAEHVQQGGVQVVDGDAVLDGVEAEFVGLRRRQMPPLKPPPAMHMVKP